MAPPGKRYIRISLSSKKFTPGAPHMKQRNESSNCSCSPHPRFRNSLIILLVSLISTAWITAGCGNQYYCLVLSSISPNITPILLFLQAQSRKWPVPSALRKVNLVCLWSTVWMLWYKSPYLVYPPNPPPWILLGHSHRNSKMLQSCLVSNQFLFYLNLPVGLCV